MQPGESVTCVAKLFARQRGAVDAVLRREERKEFDARRVLQNRAVQPSARVRASLIRDQPDALADDGGKALFAEHVDAERKAKG